MTKSLDEAAARAAAYSGLLSALLAGGSTKDSLERYRPYMDDARPEDLVAAVDAAIARNESLEALKPAVSKLINLIYASLSRHCYTPGGNAFLDSLAAENAGLAALLIRGKLLNQAMNGQRAADRASATLDALDELEAWLGELGAVEIHYRKKENVLFSWFEARYPQYRCVRLMWDIQDDARRGLKKLASWLDSARTQKEPDRIAFNMLMGRLYFDLNATITREECALFPVLAGLMDKAEAAALLAESRDYGWAFLDDRAAESFAQAASAPAAAAPDAAAGAAFSGRTGAMPAEVLGALFAALPVDLTYVDAEDRVRWFSDSPHRIFPRSPAIIGRNVRNCHPGASVGRVLAILEAFKSGAKDTESFWINMGGRFISIEYFALRAPDGRYLGTLEASQDLSEKRALTGEKRLAT